MAAICLLAALALASGFFFRWNGSPGAEVVPPERPRPVPAPLLERFQEIEGLRRSGDFAELARRYPPFLEDLARLWGGGHRDLALYHYDFGRSLVLARRSEEALAVAGRALQTWPDCLPLQLLEARVRLASAVPRGVLDTRADLVLRSLLVKANHPRLRGLSADPAALASGWAEMLFQAGRYRQALEAAESGLLADARNRECRASKAQVLLELERPGEALELLRELAAERDTATYGLYLGIALLKSGDPAAAWDRFSRLLRKERTRDEPGILPDGLLSDLRVQAGRALNQLRRPREAAEVVLEQLMEEPENDQALHLLSLTARALGAASGAAAVDLRLRQIIPREAFLESARREPTAGQEGLAAIQLAAAALAVDRSAEALQHLETARKRYPRAPQLHLEAARVLSLVGRDDLAEGALRWGFEECRSPAVLADLARLVAARGDAGQARRLLADPGAAGGAEGDGGGARSGGAALLAARRARALLELGDVPAARALLEARAGSSDRDEEALLCLAEAALLEGRGDPAAKLLAENYPQLPGGAAWAGALRAWMELSQGKELSGDLAETAASDLLDHPRLLRSPELSGPWVARLREGHQRRREMLSRIEAAGGAGVGSAWEALVDLYRELKAVRKAREAAWYLLSLSAEDWGSYRLLALTLSAPEEVVARMWALKAALRLAPGDAELSSMLAAARAFLGLSGP